MWTLSVLIPVMALIFFLYSTQAGEHPLPFLPMLLLEGMFLIIGLLFYGLYTTIDDKTVRLKYGIGLIRLTINLADIESTGLFRSSWYHGIGIRIIPGGVLYNAHSLDAVEIKLKEKKRKIWIGSAESEALQQAITQGIARLTGREKAAG